MYFSAQQLETIKSSPVLTRQQLDGANALPVLSNQIKHLNKHLAVSDDADLGFDTLRVNGIHRPSEPTKHLAVSDGVVSGLGTRCENTKIVCAIITFGFR